jgi:hypothetical protein
MLYRLITLDILDGEINDEHLTQDTITLNDGDDIDDLRTQLVKLQRMAPDYPQDDLITQEDYPEIFVCRLDGTKVYKLTPNKDQPEICQTCGEPKNATHCRTGHNLCDLCDPPCDGCYDQ